MKDRAFSGHDVTEAVAVASRTLGLAPGALRYVVLDPGKPGGLGVSPSPARIAVMLDAAPGGRTVTPDRDGAEEEAGDPQADARAIVRAVAEAAGLDLAAEVETEKDALVVRLTGADRAFWLGDGDAEVLLAFEHLMQRIFGPELSPRRVVVECEGYRGLRDEALRTQALVLAEAVRGDGTPRETAALNSYERRIIHMTLSGEPGVVTYSVGEGSDRRVTVAPAPPPPPSGQGDV